MVAKSFQNLEQVGEPFADGSGKKYVNVRTKNGSLRRVRWYDVDEYCRMYPDVDPIEIKRANDPFYKSMRHTLMGDAGWIYILEGDARPYLEELTMSPYMLYSTVFGWYMRANTPAYITEAINEWFVIHKLFWGDIGIDDEHIKNDAKEIVDIICRGRTARQWH